MYSALHFVFGFVAVIMLGFFLKALINLFMIEVEDEMEVLIMSFGKKARLLTEPGAYFCARFLPWVDVIKVSKRRDFRHYQEIFMNDSRGATMIVDLWTEVRIVDATKALFRVENWEESLRGLMINTASTFVSNHEFQDAHTRRTEVGDGLKAVIAPIAREWGIEVETIFISNIALLPEVSKQMFSAVAAKLERFKATVQEEGRLQVARLEAETNVRIAKLKATAKAQYPLAVGRAYENLGRHPSVLHAYRELYELGQLRPHRTISFIGFGPGDLSEMEAVTAVSESMRN